MKQIYIDAVLEMVKEGKDASTVLNGLQEIMAKKGHQALYGAVLRGVARVLETQKGSDVVISVARESDAQKLKSQIAEALKAVEATSDPVVEVDETLIGGAVVKNGNTVLDRSYKTALINLYRSVTRG